jgi:TPR repeat protein
MVHELEKGSGRFIIEMMSGAMKKMLSAPLRQTSACGWWGDGESDDDDDVTWLGADGKPLPEDELSIDDPETQTMLGNRFRKGDGVTRDYAKAVYWYRKAAKQGFVGAQNNLAVMYEQGLGVSKNKPEAANWFRKAAEQKDAYAQHSLGIMYRDGEGVHQNFAEAAKWISKAAEQSHHGAFRDMGEIYWKGSGLPQNEVLADMWWRIAAIHGDEEGDRLRRMAAAKMMPGRIAEAEEMAQGWIKNNQ